MSNVTKRTVLIVDDCLEDRETYRRYLMRDQNYDYTIIEAELGSEGLELWQNHQIDGVFLDYLLPDIDGIEFLQELRNLTKLTYLPVVMLTGQGNEAIAVKAMKAGASDYIVKGKTTAKELRLAINSAIDKFKLQLQLQQSQDHLQLALETAVMGTWEWNLQKNSFICSQLLAQILDIPENSCLTTYESFLETIHPQDRDVVDRAIKYAILEKSEYRLEFRHLRRDFSTAWIDARVKIYCDLKNEPVRAIATFTDITESKHQEQERQQFFLKERLVYQIAQQVRKSLDLSEILETTVRQVKLFLDCDRVLIFQFAPDWNGKVVTESVNPDFTTILGAEIYDPCFAENLVDEYENGRVRSIENIRSGEIRDCHADLLAQFQVKANLVVPILKSDKLWGLLIAHQCGASRKWQELEISLLTQLATQVGIAIQQSLLFNQVQIELNEREKAQQALQKSLQSETFLREEAETANRIKDEFLAVLSHELRSPLNPILGWSRILLKRRNLDEKRKYEALQIIERNAKIQSQLIEDLLDISRILRGKLKLEAEKVNLASVISSALETVRLSAEVKNISLRFLIENSTQANSNQNIIEVINTESNLWQSEIKSNYSSSFVLGDAARLQQIVWNLLSNAVKFTSKGGKVTIKLGAFKSQAQITVTDNGKGINQEFLPHVFAHFRQADSATTRKFGGLGLGLAIVRHLVEIHGGRVKADSLGKDKGATFTVNLPLLEIDKSQENNNDLSHEEIESYSLKGLRILVVEDEKDSREFISFVLEQDGAEVTTVTSAIEALQIFPNLKPDILVSDIGMPEMDGYMLLSKIREMQPEIVRNIPAIALTAYAGEIDRKQALSVGFQRHVTKPIEPDNLIMTVIELTKKAS
ncbi:MAG: response regulator [Cyanobacteria bacterium P01_A01_bin.68]